MLTVPVWREAALTYPRCQFFCRVAVKWCHDAWVLGPQAFAVLTIPRARTWGRANGGPARPASLVGATGETPRRRPRPGTDRKESAVRSLEPDTRALCVHRGSGRRSTQFAGRDGQLNGRRDERRLYHRDRLTCGHRLVRGGSPARRGCRSRPEIYTEHEESRNSLAGTGCPTRRSDGSSAANSASSTSSAATDGCPPGQLLFSEQARCRTYRTADSSWVCADSWRGSGSPAILDLPPSDADLRCGRGLVALSKPGRRSP
jgi:hypothetical protein